MTGIDILAMEEVAIEFAFDWNMLWISGVVVGVIGFAISCLIAAKESEGVMVPIVTTVFIIVGAILGILAGFNEGVPTKYETQYKVTISDEVKMTDFLERYEIIDTEGKIYTVREKTDE